ncbi:MULTISPECIES: helix-turn-helix domain-containing protein [Pseudomonas]|uniref:XRE family transcriptional regulator n=3 Tax=Pseudomonas TaxID=286 RepID=A0A4Z0AWM3_9PSED|nr:helix-turn-helix transcriptional regulator [Pseudomonas marginalis]TFY91202.1 XRE family transcriptional regulator [Pseudomonas kairouanensis]
MGFSNVALSSHLEIPMLARDSLAAVLRVLRRARDLKAEDFSTGIDPTHVNNLENGKVSVSLETLESVAKILDLRTVSLLVLATSLREKISPHELLAEVKTEVREFSSPRFLADFASQIENGELVRRPSGAQVSQKKLAAVRECKVAGMTQRETVIKLGLPASTVQRYWHKE